MHDFSTASCLVDSIKSFMFGSFSSRFWLLRKHINSLPLNQLKHIPFYCWDCITLKTESRDIDLVIKNEKDMKYLIEFVSSRRASAYTPNTSSTAIVNPRTRASVTAVLNPRAAGSVLFYWHRERMFPW